MIKLTEITEDNWLEVAALSVNDRQKKFLAPPIGIIARAYVYRDCNAKVRVIQNDDEIVGVAMVREFTDEPLGYELQQFMIDKRYQRHGYGTEALKLILGELRSEGHYDHVEVCVKMDDAEAIRLYNKIGFVDSGYIDEDVPDSYNLIYRFEADNDKHGAGAIKIFDVSEPAERQSITRLILEALPEWFGIHESREEYIRESASQAFFAAYDGEKTIGFLCLKETGKETVELCVMGVLKDYHRKGVGRKLFEAAREKAKRSGYSFMQVKTVQMGRYADYDATNRFYLSLGFKEFEVFPTLWDEWNPCQVYVMSL